MLQATEDLLGTTSLDELSVADILTRSQVSRSSFYFYFESKDAVAAALLRHLAHEFRGAMDLWVTERPEPLRFRLREAVQATVDIWRRHHGVLRAAYEATPRVSELGALWQSILDAYSDVAAQYIERERAAGTLPDGPNAQLLARILMSANNQAFYLHITSGQTDDEEFVEALTHMWASSIGAPTPGHLDTTGTHAPA